MPSLHLVFGPQGDGLQGSWATTGDSSAQNLQFHS